MSCTVNFLRMTKATLDLQIHLLPEDICILNPCSQIQVPTNFNNNIVVDGPHPRSLHVNEPCSRHQPVLLGPGCIIISKNVTSFFICTQARAPKSLSGLSTCSERMSLRCCDSGHPRIPIRYSISTTTHACTQIQL